MQKHIISLLFAATAAAASAADIPLEDFFRKPAQTAYTLSPDGKNIAWLTRWESRLNIMVRQPGKPDRRVTSIRDRDLQTYSWKGNQHLLYLQDKDGDENFHLYRVDLATGTSTDLTPTPNTRAFIIDWLPDQDDTVLVATNQRDPQFFDAYRLNIITGELKLDVASIDNTYAWLADHKGVIRVVRNSDGRILYRDKDGEEFRQIERLWSYSSLLGVSYTLLSFDQNNRNFYINTNVDRDKEVLIEFDPIAKKTVREVYSHPQVDVSAIEVSPAGVLQCAYADTAKFERRCFDDWSQKTYAKLESLLPDYWVNIISSDRLQQRLIIQARNDRQSGKYYLFDTKTQQLTELGSRYPWLDEQKLARVQPVSYQSRDGLTIHGYLTLPPGKENAKGLPVIVNPHGGPQYRDYWGYNAEAQFFANRGWAVFQMNFRGSTGYGKKFIEAGVKEWGGAMQDDITDGVNWLVTNGVADPQRLCIYGISYGGFATLSGIVKTPDLYRCAVDYVGVSNLFTFLETIPPYWSKPYWYGMVGDPKTDYFMLKRRSPVFHAEKIKTPLFVLHGAKDPRVSIDESRQIVEALKKNNVSVEFMVKENEGHGFQNEENRIEAYQAMEKFFSQYLNAKDKVAKN